MAAGAKYQYQELHSPTEIRLLELRPDSYNPETRIFDGRLRTVDLDDTECPEYIAVSYTWALPDLNDEDEPAYERPSPLHIRCDGQALEIRENIFDCLEQTQWVGSDDGETDFVWIDAICINQDDLTERGRQVALMQRIYAKAFATLVWLGRHDRNSRHAIPLIKRLSQVAQSLPGECFQPATLERGLSFGELCDEAFFRSVGMPALTLSDWTIISAFFERGWFHRLWTVQEFVQSRLHGGIQMLCGDSLIGMEDVVDFIGLAVYKGWINSLRTVNFMRTQDAMAGNALGVEITLLVDIIYKLQREAGGKDSITTLLREVFDHFDEDSFEWAKFAWTLSLCRHKAATDQRDRVFASRGLFTRYAPPDSRRVLDPDYSKPVKDLYTDVSRHLFDSLKNLSWLCFVEDKSFRVHQDLPSWVPDLASLPRPPPLSILRTHDVFRGCQGLGALQDSASPLWSSNGDTLHLKGAKVDRVVQGMHDVWTAINNFGFSALLLTAAKIPPYVAEECWLEALMNTLNTDGCPETVSTDHAELFTTERLSAAFIQLVKLKIAQEILQWDHASKKPAKNWWDANPEFRDLCEADGTLPSRRDFEDFHSVFTALCSTGQDSQGNTYTDSEAYIREIQEPMMPFVLSATHSHNFRTFFQTEGVRMGLAPQSARPGDEVWIFAGAKVPFIVREKGAGGYELVGHAHVHGIMQGELFRDGHSPEFESIILT